MKQERVYVVDRKGKPLMPTTRFGRVRILLKTKKAVPICNKPFTIRLKYDMPGIVQELYMGMDPGRENIGIGVSDAAGNCIHMEEVHTCSKSIRKKMDERRMHRRARRHHARLRKQRKALRDGTDFKTGNADTLRSTRECRSREISYPGMEESVSCKIIRGAEAQSANRKKRCPLTPSARQLIQMHIMSVWNMLRILPVSHICIERNSFDFQQMENQNIRIWEYSKGLLYGFKDYKEYISFIQDGKCLLCGKPIEEYHHIRPKSEGGSDTPAIIAGLCGCCHNGADGVHKNPEIMERLLELKSGLYQKHKVGLLNSVMGEIIESISALCEADGIKFSVTDGRETCRVREAYGLDKQHYVDGYMISLAGRNVPVHETGHIVYVRRRFKKKSAANIHKLNGRVYEYKGNPVALNRHKAESQTQDSLEEYMASYAENHTPEECSAHLRELTVKPAKRTYTAHRKGIWSDIHAGDMVKYEKHNKTKGNVKTDIFVADGVKVS